MMSNIEISQGWSKGNHELASDLSSLDCQCHLCKNKNDLHKCSSNNNNEKLLNGTIGSSLDNLPISHGILLEQMIEMGYPKSGAQQALEATQAKSIDSAIMWLENHINTNNEEEILPLPSTVNSSSQCWNGNINNNDNNNHNNHSSNIHCSMCDDTKNNLMIHNDEKTDTYSQDTEEIKMVIVLRKDLQMSPDKASVQCCHGAVGNVLDMVSSFKIRQVLPELVYHKEGKKEQEILTMTTEQMMMAKHLKLVVQKWMAHGEKKIVLQCDSEQQLLDIQGKASAFCIPNHLVSDTGRTELDPGTKTVVVLGPYMASIIDRVTGSLTFHQ